MTSCSLVISPYCLILNTANVIRNAIGTRVPTRLELLFLRYETVVPTAWEQLYQKPLVEAAKCSLTLLVDYFKLYF